MYSLKAASMVAKTLTAGASNASLVFKTALNQISQQKAQQDSQIRDEKIKEAVVEYLLRPPI
ncbi:MAG: hypothetical protein K0S29_326 [Gammaproteobacteria bacterium]|nr:hypothetical protein [Gammaproteobacteria bacterium]